MKILVNNVDCNAEFESLTEAKNYYKPDVEDLAECDEYAQEIEGAESLEELADVLNKYTDLFGDGRSHSVKEI